MLLLTNLAVAKDGDADKSAAYFTAAWLGRSVRKDDPQQDLPGWDDLPYLGAG